MSCLNWSELREMYESGVFEIESHTHDLHYRVETGRTHTPAFIAASHGDYEFDRYDSWESAILDDLGTSRLLRGEVSHKRSLRHLKRGPR